MGVITITADKSDPKMHFAAEELVRYLTMMGNAAELCKSGGRIILSKKQRPEPACRPLKEIDEYRISITSDGRGSIWGINSRSVLIGVYRYLECCGCRFLYPGRGGEIVPKSPLCPCNIVSRASYLFRCISIEGANSVENILDMIDWMPKAGLNGYHLQLKDCYTFFERWYGHHYNPFKQGQTLSVEKTKAFVNKIREALSLRGISLQYMGHGWVSEALGIETIGWDKSRQQLPEDSIKLLAKVNGKRGLWKNTAVDTNACYSNPAARKKIVDDIVSFCEENKGAEYVHVWLADDVNNYCECEKCREKRPSDWYVGLLNELDEALDEKQLDTHIIFLVYCETLWAPEENKLKHPSRFAMIFAPVSLDYTKSLRDDGTEAETEPFVLNAIHEPESAAENIAYYRSWKKWFDGPSFIYLYHLLSCGWEKDITGYQLARILHEDIAALAEIGLDGASACQAQRACFPTGFCLYVQARTLWDKTFSFEELTKDYFASAFGDNYEKALGILLDILDHISPEWLQYKTPRADGEQVLKLLHLQTKIEEHKKTSSMEKDKHMGSQAVNWRYMEIFCILLQYLIPLFLAEAGGDKAEAEKAWNVFSEELFRYEDELQQVFDMEWFVRNFELYQVRGWKNFVNQPG